MSFDFLKSMITLSEALKLPKKYYIVDINIDYENDNGRDVNRDFKICIDCGTEETALAYQKEFEKASDDFELRLADEAAFDADDIVNGSTYSATLSTSKIGLTNKVPKNSFETTLKDFKYDKL